MTDTVNLGLPCIEGSQAQKHVTHNDALRILDTLVQLAVADRDLTAPPGAPAEGERWIVKSAGTDAWAGHDNAIAAWQDGAWQFSAPQTGWIAFIADEGKLLVWNGTAWSDFFSAVALQNLTLLGVGTTADATNPLSAKLNNALFVGKTVAEGGDGNLRYKLSKESAAKTLSFLFQDNYSGRAEIGLAGDDDFHFKVSPDGSTWYDTFVIDRSSGLFSKSPNRVQADVFASSGSYTVPAWAKRIRIEATGGGGAGGSGAAGDNSSNRYGGGGAAAGAIAFRKFLTSDLASSLSVTVGAGGAPPAGVTGNNNGNAGGAGGNTYVNSGANRLVYVIGGSGGGAGTTSSGSGSGSGMFSMFPIQAGGSSSAAATGGPGNRAVAISAGSGAAGGAIDTSSTMRAGGDGGAGYLIGAGATGGSGGAAGGTAATAGQDKQGTFERGGGGGGGGANTGGNGGAGGAGGTPGAGGGGGGAARNANTSGAGGAGGAGEVWIFAYS